jgi:hypothetical protein
LVLAQARDVLVVDDIAEAVDQLAATAAGPL